MLSGTETGALEPSTGGWALRHRTARGGRPSACPQCRKTGPSLASRGRLSNGVAKVPALHSHRASPYASSGGAYFLRAGRRSPCALLQLQHCAGQGGHAPRPTWRCKYTTCWRHRPPAPLVGPASRVDPPQRLAVSFFLGDLGDSRGGDPVSDLPPPARASANPST